MIEQYSLEEWNRKSWVESANDPACGFPLQSLPYCVMADGDGKAPGVGIGSLVLSLAWCSRNGLLDGMQDSMRKACGAESLNALMACGPDAQTALRARLTDLLDARASVAMPWAYMLPPRAPTR